MQVDISSAQECDLIEWDIFAGSQKDGCLYHLSAWRDVVARSYSHETNYIIAASSQSNPTISTICGTDWRKVGLEEKCARKIVGILPLVHIRHRLFGNTLVSMPFCDAGGVLAIDANIERQLVEHGLRIADELSVPVVEFRQFQPLACMNDPGFTSHLSTFGQKTGGATWNASMVTGGNKVRMLLTLPSSSELLMQSFKSKLRSQIGKATRGGLIVTNGGIELIDGFYDVFATNMRDLGSPVHAKSFIQHILRQFPGRASIFVVYKQSIPVACSLTIGFNGVLSNPWASALRRYSQYSPNMLLYWTMLEHACRQGYQTFDFGRSTFGEGTYRFKEQWGAIPSPLYWYRFVRNDHSTAEMGVGNRSMRWAMECWKHLPISITRVLGPRIRRYISL